MYGIKSIDIFTLLFIWNKVFSFDLHNESYMEITLIND
eukprot:UN22280